MSHINKLCAIGVVFFSMLPATSYSQSLTLDTPTDLEHARLKADKAWKAWEAQGHIEPRLLSMPVDKALTEIRKDGRLADQYLTARQLQVKLLSEDFRRRATALESASGVPDLSALKKSGDENLAALIADDMKASAEISKSDKDPDPGQGEAKRQAAVKEAEYYRQLADEVHKRVEVLQTVARSDEQYTENEHALIETLNRVSATLDEQGAALAQEREDWQNYHKHLEDVVVGRSHGSSKKAAAPDDETQAAELTGTK